MPPESFIACTFSGQLNEACLDEYTIVHGTKGGTLWQRRMIGMIYAASVCDGLGHLTGAISLNPPSIRGLMNTSWRPYSDGDRSLYLDVYGPGDDRPFALRVQRICEAEGTPTAYNGAS